MAGRVPAHIRVCPCEDTPQLEPNALSVMAGRVPATHPQSAGPPRRLHNRQCVGGLTRPP